MSRKAASSIINQISRTSVRQASVTSVASKRLLSTATSSNYVSPYNDIFQSMKSNKPLVPIAPDREIPMLKCGIPETVLKFRTTSYSRLMLAPYVNQNEYKVILQVKLKHLPIETDLEKEIFHQIVQTRFDHELGELKLTCNKFASRIENKRHLCWMLDRIVIGAKRLAEETK